MKTKEATVNTKIVWGTKCPFCGFVCHGDDEGHKTVCKHFDTKYDNYSASFDNFDEEPSGLTKSEEDSYANKDWNNED